MKRLTLTALALFLILNCVSSAQVRNAAVKEDAPKLSDDNPLATELLPPRVNEEEARKNPLEPSPSAMPEPNYIIGTNVVVSYADSRDAIWGFSKITGKWTRQTIEPASVKNLVPIVSQEVACVQVDSAVYAYSSKAGRWDVLRLAQGRKLEPAVDKDLILVQDGRDIYTFAASTGRWSSPNGALGADLPIASGGLDGSSMYSGGMGAYPGGMGGMSDMMGVMPGQVVDVAQGKADADQRIEVFALMFVKAESAAKLISPLFDSDGVMVAADPRTNSLIVRGPAAALAEIEALLLRLDKTDSPSAARMANPGVGDAGSVGMPAGEEGFGDWGSDGVGIGVNAERGMPIDAEGFGDWGSDGVGIGVGAERGMPIDAEGFGDWGSSGQLDSPEQLTIQFRELDQKTVELAMRYRKRMESGQADRSELRDLNKRLRDSVTSAFEVRQRLQQVEVAELRRELDSIQRTIVARQRFKDKIIERRVSDLLNPQLRWSDDSETAAAPDQAANIQPMTPIDGYPMNNVERVESPLDSRRKQLGGQRRELFEQIVDIELSVIELTDSRSKDYVKKLTDDVLNKMSEVEKERWQAETLRTQAKADQLNATKESLLAELDVVDRQLSHLNSRLEVDSSSEGSMGRESSGRFMMPPHVVFYHADWCLSCAAIKPEIEQLRAHGLPIVFRDLTNNDTAAKLAGIKTIPTFELWIDGEMRERLEGNQYKKVIEKLREAMAVSSQKRFLYLPTYDNVPKLGSVLEVFDEHKLKLSVGADAGVQEGARLYVIRRDGNRARILAQMVVETVESDTSIARLENQKPIVPITPGDEITRESDIDFSALSSERE